MLQKSEMTRTSVDYSSWESLHARDGSKFRNLNTSLSSFSIQLPSQIDPHSFLSL